MGRLRRASVGVFASVLAPLTGLSAQNGPTQASSSLPRSPSTADVAAVATPATVTILALGARNDTLALGSGFIVRETGVIVTNFHVMRGASAAVVLLANKDRVTRVSVVDADSTIDLALLKIPGSHLPALITRSTTPRVGEKVIAIGSPLGLSETVSEGIVSATRLVGAHEIVQITAPISHGSSGGAVLDADGRVFAVSTSLLADGQAINFAIPVRYALDLLRDEGRTRSVSDVFAALAPIRSARAGATSDATRRADPPRASVVGIYRVGQRVHSSADSSDKVQVGFLIATEHVGLLALANVLGHDSLSSSHIYEVTRWATAANGDVVLVAGGLTWDGYQTADGGFVASGRGMAPTGAQLTLTMGALPASLPLSRNDGIFSVTTRTKYRTNKGVVTPISIDWRGELVVAFGHDTLHAAMYLTNDRGGNVTFNAVAPLVNRESFDLVDARGARLKGVVRNGVLTASWEDARADGAAFVGTLTAERR
jgi:trypsin-like peptidase